MWCRGRPSLQVGCLGCRGAGWTVPGCLDVGAAGTPVPESGGKPCVDRLEGARWPELRGGREVETGKELFRASQGDVMGGR